MEQARQGHPLTDEELLELGQHCYRAAEGDSATEREFTALRDIFPAVLHRLREKVEVERSLAVLDLRDCGEVIDDTQVELWPTAR